MRTMWAMSLRYAASDTAAVRPALLMEGRGGSAVDITVVARGTRVALLDVCWVIAMSKVEGTRCSFSSSTQG